MTEKEAINLIKLTMPKGNSAMDIQLRKALEVAIQALEKYLQIKEIIGVFQNDMYDDEVAELFFKIKEMVS